MPQQVLDLTTELNVILRDSEELRYVYFRWKNSSKVLNGVQRLFVGSKVLFCFEICTPEARGRDRKLQNKGHRTFDPRNIFSPVHSIKFHPRTSLNESQGELRDKTEEISVLRCQVQDLAKSLEDQRSKGETSTIY